MPSLQTITLTDRKATPTNIVMTPIGKTKDGYALLRHEDGGAAVGQRTLEVGSSANGSGVVRSELKYKAPKVQSEIINGVSRPVKVGETTVVISVISGDTVTEAELNDIIGEAVSAFLPAKVLVNDTFVKRQRVW